ncbi:MAG: amidohydrolase family protein [Gemmatimonadota bacterium]
MRSYLVALGLMTAGIHSLAAQRPTLGGRAKAFVSVDAPVVALTHARVIDGTGAAPVEDQTVIITDGKITALGKTGSVSVPSGAKEIDLTGKSVLPGLIGLHDHSYYTTSSRTVQSNFSAPLLYLAAGLTTIRTTGANNPYAELNLKREVDAGRFPGTRMFITGPYLTGGPTGSGSMVPLNDEAEARRVVAYWAEEGVQWLKFYTGVSRAAMKAAIDEGHKRGLKFTGHLCSVPYREAVALGMDGLEHGMFANSDYDKTRTPDQCSPNMMKSYVGLDVNSPEVQATFKDMTARNVALTSTLVVYELFVANRPPLEQRVLDAMSPDARTEYLTSRSRIAETPNGGIPLDVFKTGMKYEYAFVKAGGLLASGVDPTGNGGALFGFGDQRNLELLVEAGFTPLEAIQIGSANGAKALGIYDKTGSIAVGKLAELVVVNGNPAAQISDIKKVETIFRDGYGWDSAKMIEAVRGQVGVR